MKVLETHKKPMDRQIHEGVALELTNVDMLLNSKAEWHGSRLPRIVIEERDRQIEDEKGAGSKMERGKKKDYLVKINDIQDKGVTSSPVKRDRDSGECELERGSKRRKVALEETRSLTDIKRNSADVSKKTRAFLFNWLGKEVQGDEKDKEVEVEQLQEAEEIKAALQEHPL